MLFGVERLTSGIGNRSIKFVDNDGLVDNERHAKCAQGSHSEPQLIVALGGRHNTGSEYGDLNIVQMHLVVIDRNKNNNHP